MTAITNHDYFNHTAIINNTVTGLTQLAQLLSVRLRRTFVTNQDTPHFSQGVRSPMAALGEHRSKSNPKIGVRSL
ncbi:hypothetical protein [Nostoc sp.]